VAARGGEDDKGDEGNDGGVGDDGVEVVYTHE
jgi:hypothetical protein